MYLFGLSDVSLFVSCRGIIQTDVFLIIDCCITYFRYTRLVLWRVKILAKDTPRILFLFFLNCRDKRTHLSVVVGVCIICLSFIYCFEHDKASQVLYIEDRHNAIEVTSISVTRPVSEWVSTPTMHICTHTKYNTSSPCPVMMISIFPKRAPLCLSYQEML